MSSEYKYWFNYFENIEFKKKISHITKQAQNQKVLLYCAGTYFDVLTNVFDLTKYFKIVGISDIKYEKNPIENYKGFKCIKPSEIATNDFDYVLITSPNTQNIEKYLLSEIKISKNKILNLNINNEKYFANIQNNYNSVIKNLKQKEKINIVFVVEENSKWGYQFLYEQLKKDKYFNVLPIVLLPIITNNRIEFTQKENLKFFKELNIDAVDYYDYENEENKDLKLLSPDIVFYQQPWYLMNINHPANVSKYALTCMAPYGYTTLSSKEWGSNHVKEIYKSLWCFFSESSYHNEFYKKVANMNNNLLAVGSPKFDYYKTSIKDKIPWKGKNIKAKIIYAPHHSLRNNGLKMSTFDKYYKLFFELAKNNPQYSFILKPHPALKSMCAFEKFLTFEEYENYINDWNSLPNAYVYDKGNYFDIFKSSDILITDCSSFLAEYFPTQNPIIFINRPDRASFDEFGEHIKQGFYETISFEDIEKTLNNLIVEKKDELYSLRQEILKKYFYIPEKMVCKQITEFIKEKLIH